MRPLLLFFILTFIIAGAGLGTYGQSSGGIRIILTDGRAIEVEEAWEDSQGVWYRHDGITHLMERARVRRVERPGRTQQGQRNVDEQPSLSMSQDQPANGSIWIHLVGGARMEVDEASEAADGVWYRRGHLTAFLEKARVERVERADPPRPESPKSTFSPDRFPPNYFGINAASAFLTLNRHRAALSKSQFETTAEYNARVSRLLSGIRLGGGAGAAGELTFVVRNVDESYDADGRIYTVQLNTEIDVGPEAGGTFTAITLGSTSKTLGSSVGQNAFGVRKRFIIRSYSSLKLVVPVSKISFSSPRFRIRVVASTQARQMMGYVCAALVGRLRRPFISEDSDYDNATITDPEEAHYRNYHLIFDPETAVFFHKRTGEIYGTVDLSSARGREYLSSVPTDINPVRSPVRKRKATEVKDTASSPSQTAVVSDGESDWILLSKPQPKFPLEARTRTTGGTVKLSATLDASGHVTEIKVVEGQPFGMTESAIEALKQVRFIPAKKAGNPVPVRAIFEYEFNVL